jgi:siroheme synthase (precorrin-2 oxidase/ferrochelatase)
MSRLLKEHIDRNLPPTWEKMVELMEMVRHQLKAEMPEQLRREGMLRKLSEDPEIWASLDQGVDVAFQLAMRKAEE